MKMVRRSINCSWNFASIISFHSRSIADRANDKQTWKWSHTSATPDYLERRHQYRRSEFRYRSKKAAKKISIAKSASLERGRKQRGESFISYSRDELFKKCEHGDDCECQNVKNQLSDALKAARSKSETRKEFEKAEMQRRKSEVVPLSPLEIKIYTSKTLPKRIEKLKQKKLQKQSSKFYTDLNDNDDNPSNELKIVESTDDGNREIKVDEVLKNSQDDDSNKLNDSDIIRSILEKSEIAPQRRLSKGGGVRRKSIEQMDSNCTHSPLSSRKLSEALAAIQLESSKKQKQNDSQTSPTSNSVPTEPLYEELLRNVHVPYKFAPSMVKRSLSTSSSSSTRETASLSHSKATSSITINDNDDSDCDYVTLTYSNDGALETVDGEFVNRKSPNESASPNELSRCDSFTSRQSSFLYKMNPAGKSIASPSLASIDNSVISMSSNELNRRDSFTAKPKSFLYKMTHKKSVEDDFSSQRSIAVSIGSRKSFDGTNMNANSPTIYHQGSEFLGNRIANNDYADPKTLFPSTVNIFINKSSMSQRDSLVTSSSDSVCDSQKLKQSQSEIEQFSCGDSFYEETAENLLENDFRDSAIYSDDSNEKKSDLNNLHQRDEHIYATVNKVDRQTPPKIPKKPQIPIPVKVVVGTPKRLQSPPPPVPTKPSCLKSPEVRNAILNIRKHSKSVVESESRKSANSIKY